MTAVAVILKGYPRLSETFIAQEILALQRRGLDLRIVSLRHPTDKEIHPVHREITAPVSYLPEYLHSEPFRVLRGFAAARKLPGYARARATWRHDLARDRTRNRVRRFGQACVLAAELPGDITHLYAHFLHTPASVTRYAAIMRGLPWSCSAHAKDIWTSPNWEIAEKLADAAWTVTCTRAGFDRLAGLAPDPDKVGLVYHGLDLDRFPPPTGARPARDGGDPGEPAIILSVGRAVEKKGYGDLLAALALLPPEMNWRFRHIGGGGVSDRLKAEAERLGITGRICWLGARSQEKVLEELRAADLFVLSSKIGKDGDRDGLPNVLMEAASQTLPLLATSVSGIPELVEDGRTGLLVEPGDIEALARSLARLIRDPELRRELGAAGARKVGADFSLSGNIAGIAARFGLTEPREQATACE
ncbi:MAG: glycosyltransferase [Proteobacteria bacterium]|nr:glycosyltransferase [Pseudomonadota bacterium]